MFVSQACLQTQNCDDAVSTASSGFGCDEKTIKAVCEQKVSYSSIENLVALKWHSICFKINVTSEILVFFKLFVTLEDIEGLLI